VTRVTPLWASDAPDDAPFSSPAAFLVSPKL
jgi:hypothetical protein